MKRARLYNSCRSYVQTLYRHRSALDDKLLIELVELSLSPYVRVRRYVSFFLNLSFCA
jgi:proteasome activator subunit 4